MNANELADEIDSYWKSWQQSIPIFEKAATMLRQQQAEIEALKAELRLIDELVTEKAQEK